IVVLVCFAALPAFSQETLDQRVRQGRNPTIQSSITMTLPLDTAKDPNAQQEEMLRSFYQMAARSCTFAIDTVADSCEISSISTNTRVDDSNPRGSRLSLTGQIMMTVKFKSEIGKPAQ
ncbi:hypothetical protein AB4144_56615, partial [Rhizobiaceae sp. 2RAB30]